MVWPCGPKHLLWTLQKAGLAKYCSNKLIAVVTALLYEKGVKALCAGSYLQDSSALSAVFRSYDAAFVHCMPFIRDFELDLLRPHTFPLCEPLFLDISF